MTLTVCIIARDEEELIAGCLNSLSMKHDPAYTHQSLWDELVVVDAGGSTDRTMEIVRQFGPVVTGSLVWQVGEDGQELRDYAAARNYAETLATGDYILWIDADERLISGHERIREIVNAGEVDSIRPICTLTNVEGIEYARFVRQDLLHRRGTHVWKGKRHEWTEGPLGSVEQSIIYNQRDRIIDRPHGDELESLRSDVVAEEDPEGNQRALYHLALDHLHRSHYHEALALFDFFLARKGGIPRTRSLAALFAGDALKMLDDIAGAKASYLRGVQEDATWAEPYYLLGVLALEEGQAEEAVAWLSASTIWQPNGTQAHTEIYEKHRWEKLALALDAVGQTAQADGVRGRVCERASLLAV